MEGDMKNQRTAISCNGVSKADFLLQWGNRRKLRCSKVKAGEEDFTKKSKNCIKKPVIKEAKFVSQLPQPNLSSKRKAENLKLEPSVKETEDRHYTTRGSMGSSEENGKNLNNGGIVEGGGGEVRWPKLLISLSNKEKEEDFMAMKGCKLPQRPKKRAKFIQKTLHLVSPGTWLSDLCQERYEVREKKTSKKKARGLKGMGRSTGSDSE